MINNKESRPFMRMYTWRSLCARSQWQCYLSYWLPLPLHGGCMGSTGEPVDLAEGHRGLWRRILVYSHDPLRFDQMYKSKYAPPTY